MSGQILEQGLITLSILSAIISVGLGIAFLLAARRLGVLSADIESTGSGPVVNVIVPARNEERDLERAVRSILAQQCVQVRVVVVNDQSTDRTREIADSLASADDRVAVIHDPRLAEGWLGKTNAMQHGLLASTAQYIVFTDADVIHASRCFASALGEMRKQQIDFLSLCPTFEFESFWENALLPHVLIAGTVQFLLQNVNDSRSPNAAAAGALMITRHDVLDRVGGLESIKSEILDDIALAKSLKQQGFETRMWLAPDLLSVRLFKGNHDAFWGLTKNILGAVDHLWMAAPAMFLPIFVYWVPIATCVLGALRAEPGMIVAGVAPYIIQVALLLLIVRMCRIRWIKALCFPLAAAPVMCCFLKALYYRYVSGAVAWRGRVIPLDGS